MDEHVLAAVIADDEAETLLGIEEFDDALAFANDLRGHSAATAAAAAKAAAAATAAAATAAAAAAVAATAAAAATAAEAAAVAKAAAAAAVAAALLESACVPLNCLFAETVTFIAAAPAAVAFAPSIETHARPNFLVPTTT